MVNSFDQVETHLAELQIHPISDKGIIIHRVQQYLPGHSLDDIWFEKPI